MNSRKWTWVLSLVVALGVLAGGVRAASASLTVDNLPQVKLPSAAKFVMSGSISSVGQTVPVNGSGAFSGQNDMLNVTLMAPSGVTTGPDKVTLDAIVVSNTLYFKTANLGAGTDDKWYSIDLGKLTGTMPGAVMGMPGSLTDVQAMLAAAVTIKVVGKEAIGGAPTTKYQIDVDLAKVATASGGSTTSVAGSTLTMFLWVGDADMYVHQFNTMLNIADSSGAGIGNIAVDLTITSSDFDVPVNITAPADAIPLDLSASDVGSILGTSMGMPVEGTGIGMPKTGSGSGDNNLPLALLALSMGLVLSGATVRRLTRGKQQI